MLLHCCYTPAHEVLYREIFLPSVPEGFEVRSHLLDIDGPGDYLSGEFLRCIRAKLDLVIESVAANPGQTIVWSDVDIRFFNLTPESLGAELDDSQCDLLFQRESPRIPDVNTGFFVCTCTSAVLDFFRAVRTELDLHPEENEQMVVNRLLEKAQSQKNPENSFVPWSYLPASFYARTQCWPPPAKIALYHANCTSGPDGVGQKILQFHEIEWIQRYGEPARLWSVIRRVPEKLSAIFRNMIGTILVNTKIAATANRR